MSTLVTSARNNGYGGPRAPQDRSKVRKTNSTSKFSLSRCVAGGAEGPEAGEPLSLRVSRWLSNCWLHHFNSVESWASHLAPLSPRFLIFMRGLMKTPYKAGFPNGGSRFGTR